MVLKDVRQGKVGVVIPTRNRPEEVLELLNSLSHSSVMPFEVIVVASGQDIESELRSIETPFNLIYRFTAVRGQVAQKSLGLQLISPDVEWVIFTDDDLLFTDCAIEVALEAAANWPASPVLGVGFSLPSTSRIVQLSEPLRLVARFLGLDAKESGRVLKSGHGTNYLVSIDAIETQWLNGASMWRSPEVMAYSSAVPSSEYAACEDLFFSYHQHHQGILIFSPNAKIMYQEGEVTNPESPKVFVSAAYWRLAFVRRHSELSIFRFFVAQLLRTFFAINKTSHKRARIYLFSLLGLLRDHFLIKEESQLFSQLTKRISQLTSQT
jgi:glycosyltransferase involved in cell wall biosynthesis